MADKTKTEIAALVNFTEKGPVTTSLKIAEVFDKRHADLMNIIKRLKCSPDFRARNFSSEFHTVPTANGGSRKVPMFSVTKDGLVMLAGKINTKESAALLERYIAAFNFMTDRSTDTAIRELSDACDKLKQISACASDAGATLARSKKAKRLADAAIQESIDRLQLSFSGLGFEVAQARQAALPKKARKTLAEANGQKRGAPSLDRPRSTSASSNEAGQPGDSNGDPLLSREQ